MLFARANMKPSMHINQTAAGTAIKRTDAALTRIATAESAAYMSADPATADPV